MNTLIKNTFFFLSLLLLFSACESVDHTPGSISGSHVMQTTIHGTNLTQTVKLTGLGLFEQHGETGCQWQSDSTLFKADGNKLEYEVTIKGGLGDRSEKVDTLLFGAHFGHNGMWTKELNVGGVTIPMLHNGRPYQTDQYGINFQGRSLTVTVSWASCKNINLDLTERFYYQSFSLGGIQGLQELPTVSYSGYTAATNDFKSCAAFPCDGKGRNGVFKFLSDRMSTPIEFER